MTLPWRKSGVIWHWPVGGIARHKDRLHFPPISGLEVYLQAFYAVSCRRMVRRGVAWSRPHCFLGSGERNPRHNLNLSRILAKRE